ncbi:MAG: hypothetical protein IJT16_09440 [Lachnospiraceae bacterium]|nr:hypothetical protein [Lachnospiraceae bacterium]
MSSSQLYPFERNRYYPGKMLTSADLLAEQNYHINKNRFLNGLLYGKGIICGLGVVGLDDYSVLIESGAAIDGSGREIVVEKSVVKKLSAIEGFDELKGDVLLLKARYHEEAVHSVYSVNHKEDENEYEYNRIAESYEFFLTEDEEQEAVFDEEDFLLRETLFKNENYTGTVTVPKAASVGKTLKIVLEIQKTGTEETSLTCRGVLEMPLFLTPEGEHELDIGVSEVSLKKGESLKKEYWVKVMETEEKETELILRSGSVSAFEDEQAVNVTSHFSLRVLLSDLPPLAIVSRLSGEINLEKRNGEYTEDAVSLARIRLLRNTGSYIIDSIEEGEVKSFILSPSGGLLRDNYLSYYVKDAELKMEQPAVSAVTSVSGKKTEFSNIASGVLEVPLGRNAREGDIRYSGEIAHGLGPGNVYINVGYNYVADDPRMGTDQKSTIYGNPEIFSRKNDVLTDVETAVKVLEEKGTFVVGVRLLHQVDYLVLSFRWVAIRFPSGEESEFTEDYYDKSISVDTPTVVLAAKESHFFGVRFNNMKKCSITYELTAPGSGEISSDGIYTAPSRDGVYEIRIYCTDMPVICTYAYAIVKKKMSKSTEEEEAPAHTNGNGGAL